MSVNWTKEQHDAIYHKGHNILVSAGAGSGKTAVLTERALQYVLSGKDIDHMLILTFTNAAAAQMKEKIRKKIKECSELDGDAKKKQLNKIDSSYIMTFDAYALSLVKKYHYLLNVSKNVNIIETNMLDIRFSEYLDEIMAEKYENHEVRFEKLIGDFCSRDDRTVRKWVETIYNKLLLRDDREEYLNNYIENYYSEAYADSLFERYTESLLEELKIMDDMFSQLSALDTGNFDEFYRAFKPLLQATSYEEIRSKLEFKNPNRKKFSPAARNLSERILKKISSLRDELIYTEKEVKENYLSTRDYAEELIDIVRKLYERLDEYKNTNDLYDYSDVFAMALKIVKEHEDIRKQISEYFFEIMIDEYQDTNDLQDYFISLIAHDNVYMVGDIKQSIYRFRNANPDIFQQKYAEYKTEASSNEVIDLLQNFRSRTEVVDSINKVFGRLMDNEVGGADYRKEHEMRFGQKEYVNGKSDYDMEILTYAYDRKNYPFNTDPAFNKDEVEAFIVAQDIKKKMADGFEVYDFDLKKLRPATYSDFCILMSKSKNFDLFKKILTLNRIPVRIEQDEEIKGSDLLTVIKNIFRLLDGYQKQDKEIIRYNFISTARSFLMEMPDSEIYDVVTNGRIDSTDLMKKIMLISESIEGKTITDLLDEIIDRFEVYDRMARIGELNDNLVRVNYLYQWAHNLNTLDYSYMEFVEYLDHIFDDERKLQVGLNKPDIDAVKILTIHKSKGLQYHVCYFPQLDSRFNDDDLKKAVTCDPEFGIITPCFIADRGSMDTIARKLYKTKYYSENRSEQIRLFYVALTRTMEKIILVMPDKDNDYGEEGILPAYIRTSFSKMADMISYQYANYAKNRSCIDLENPDLGFTKEYRSNSLNDLDVLKDRNREKIELVPYEIPEPEVVMRSHYSKSTGLITAELKNTMEFGTEMHYYLETLDFRNPDYSQMNRKAADRVRKFMESDLMKNAAQGKAYKEYEFIYMENGEMKHGFIDLLMEYDDHFDIIDYKLKHIDDDNYFLQLSGYRTYLQSISEKPVKCYLYSLIEARFREVE